ncbi:YihY/virulence factor BrkB family protein [Halorarum halophilum]|uniref:YihY/virulence factor BrkB family protein n=1 Tax=Halorarum halophilum TaxID=2743090 RepID=A0A7D5JZR6_9EURY|nr:YihY/virulence factor BrkB family protein [Halobaculum halophilum]QLG26121.1 YihY/virulence factor BrkB family protein [Halobaculum halophilum]
MIPDRRRVVSVARAVVHEIRTENVTFLAGSIAYHAFVSLLPLLLLVVLVLSSAGNGGLQSAFESLVRGALTQNAGSELLSELERAGQSRGLSVAGLGVLVWGSLRIFRGLDTAFSDIYETEAENTFLDQLGDALLLLLVFGVGVVLAAFLRQYVPSGGDGLLWPIVSRILLVLALVVALFPMYYVFPDTDVGVVEVLPGTAFAAVGLTVFESLFQVYAQWGGTQQDPSVVAAILVFLTWLYFSGLVILVGASVNAVLSNRSADVAIDPVVGGAGREPERPTSDEVVRAITELESMLADPGALTVTVGDRSVTFPPPQRLSTDTEPSVLDAHDVGVELRWAVDSTATGLGGDEVAKPDVDRTVERDDDGDGGGD